MQAAAKTDSQTHFQTQFHSRWGHLQDRHVRALAWLLWAPDLLDWQAPQWQGKIARLPLDPQIGNWLTTLDQTPQPLHAWLEFQPRMRLGRYAEKLVAFYFHQRGLLVAHNVQVQDEHRTTIGEFDFLLRNGDALLHWEFATKFYLLQGGGEGAPGAFMGPSLADMLHTKMRKVLERQLALGQQPAAQEYLQQALAGAQALIKGWLFYRTDAASALPPTGLAAGHCSGYWCELANLDQLPRAQYALLDRREWLAPAKVVLAECVSHRQLRQTLSDHFGANHVPVLVAQVDPCGVIALETERWFVVPDDWPQQARERTAALEKGD